MKSLKVALLQIMPTGTQQGNLEKGTEYCRLAREMGADIALFPEMWNVGYCIPEDIDFAEFKGLRLEAREKLGKVRPVNVGQASRIPGVSPSDISALLLELKARGI